MSGEQETIDNFEIHNYEFYEFLILNFKFCTTFIRTERNHEAELRRTPLDRDLLL